MPRAKEMLSRLSTAFRKDEDSNNYKVLSIIAEEFDEIEQVIEQLRNSRFVEIATGRSLDYIAKLFNLTRKSEETDEELRGRLQVELQKYLSCGTLNDILNVIKYFTGLEDKDIKIVEAPDAILGFGEGSFGNNVFSSPKATFRIEFKAPALQLNLKAFYNAVKAVKAAGVYFQQDETVLWFIGPSARTSGESEAIWFITTPLGFGHGRFGELGFSERLDVAIITLALTLLNAALALCENTETKYQIAPLGFGQSGFGQITFGDHSLVSKTEAETYLIDLTVLAFPASTAGIKSGLGFGYGSFGELGFSDRYDMAVIEWMLETFAAALADGIPQVIDIDIHTYFAFGEGGFGHYQFSGGTVSSASELDYVEKKRITYSKATKFTKIKFNIRQNSTGTGWIKVEYQITAPDGTVLVPWTVLCEVNGGANDSFGLISGYTRTSDPVWGEIYEVTFDHSINYGDTIEYRLLMKNSDTEACYNNIFDVWGEQTP